MSTYKRNLRSSKLATAPARPASLPAPVTFQSSATSTSANEPIQILIPGSKLPGLPPAELSLLRKKQRQLQSSPAPSLLAAIRATLIFAQHEAGTAVCIHPAGWLLTCSHCIAEDRAEWLVPENRRKWLLYHTGMAVQVECRAWDPRQDLALLKIIAVETSLSSRASPSSSGNLIPHFAFMQLASEPPVTGEDILCIGQPGRDDLEAEDNRQTKYGLFEVSEGAFRGMVRGADAQDNSQIGTLKHDAWTYWGHSGAPLSKAVEGSLVGLHSSWDDETGMRHGIPLVAIRDFLRENLSIDMKLLEAGNGDVKPSRESKWEPTGNYEDGDYDGNDLSTINSKQAIIDLTGSSLS